MMRWRDCLIVAFDTETTGLQAFNGDRIIEFGAVEIFVNDEIEVYKVKHHQFMINPQMPIPREASNVSGIFDEDVARAPVFEKVASKIFELLSDSILVAHNFGFDLGFLRTEFQSCGLGWPKTYAEIDTLAIARRLMKELKSRRLEKVAEALNVTLTNAHRAVDDAEACGRVLISMAKRYGAPETLEGLMEWAVAVGPPPQSGHVAILESGVPEFIEGKYKGESVEKHPDYLQWMTLAKLRTNGIWQYRYPDSLRQWAHRWLRARTAGGSNSASRGGGSRDWNLDPTPWREGEL